jgi:protein-S-isoprenylcysteine O-methyltransferase Ste14
MSKVSYREGDMSLIPEFQLGLWNAWIITILGFIFGFLTPYINKEVTNKRFGKMKWSELSKIDMSVFIITHIIIFPFTLIYSFFLPFKLGTVWFYVGLPIGILGIVIELMAGISFATAPLDKPMTKGAYGISRNPMYFGGFLEFVGISIACLSWVFLLCAVAWIISFHIGVVKMEEPSLIKRYGDAYREYMKRTPRWIGIPRSD